MAGLPVTVGSEQRSDAIGMANPAGLCHPAPRGEHPKPDERASMTVARGHQRGRRRTICCQQRAIGRDVDISWLPTARSERNNANMPPLPD
jgi:hypothetical protein